MQVNQTINSNDITTSSVRDYIALLKPRVMSLVVFIGVIGLYLAPGEVHPFMAVTAVACIALGSGAAGAFNMWYEHKLDAKMKRTKHRPIPAGKIRPEDAFDFASVTAFASVFIMAAVVGIIAAFWLLVAILFYVFVYTIFLKQRTPQNIVIGGAAGAFPPVIGWAAVTGDTALLPWVLFAITFFWTPPHFWALALYKTGDYGKAGIPMMPNVVGRRSTQWQMLSYTLLLLPISLVPSFMGAMGLAYTVVAGVLGAWFIMHAIRVLKTDSDDYAKSMFFFSIWYLFAIFTMLAVDHALQHSLEGYTAYAPF